MGIRGELFSTKVSLQNRTYFFNVKENRLGDLYLNIVESKNRDEGGFERQSVILFAEDLEDFLRGFEESLKMLEKAAREKRRGKNVQPIAKSRDSEREYRKSDAPRRSKRPDSDRRGDRPRSDRTRDDRPRDDRARSDRPRGDRTDRSSSSSPRFHERQNFKDKEKKEYPPRKNRVVVRKHQH